jgi:beta-glucanase (GH16 family)
MRAAESFALIGVVLLCGTYPATAQTTGTITAVSEGTPKAVPFISAQAPALPSLSEGGFALEPAFEDQFEPGWEGSQKSWKVATWKQNGTQMSPERCRTDGKGHLVQTVLAGEPFQGGSLQTNREFGWGRWVARVKPSAVPGLLNSIFTKDWDNLTTPADQHDGNKGEVDFEFVTHTFGNGRGEAHLAIHLKEHHPLWHLDIPLDFDPSQDFHEWGFDILPDRVVWHVDGKVLHTWMYTKEHSIDPAYEFFFNSWTAKKWLKGPPGEKAEYHIDWLKFYPLQKNPEKAAKE